MRHISNIKKRTKKLKIKKSNISIYYYTRIKLLKIRKLKIKLANMKKD